MLNVLKALQAAVFYHNWSSRKFHLVCADLPSSINVLRSVGDAYKRFVLLLVAQAAYVVGLAAIFIYLYAHA